MVKTPGLASYLCTDALQNLGEKYLPRATLLCAACLGDIFHSHQCSHAGAQTVRGIFILMSTAQVVPGLEGLKTLLAVNAATICFIAICSPNIPPSFGQLEGVS